ncbi:MAG: hypothetical protein LBG52_04550 [Candidatus Peribacteria bacterium]|nr:hypothetical protein [Candidatus Peribacteria bacterium]
MASTEHLSIGQNHPIYTINIRSPRAPTPPFAVNHGIRTIRSIVDSITAMLLHSNAIVD